MSTTIKEQTDSLRHALERAACAYEQAAALYRRTQASLDAEPENAPTAEAMTLLAAHGFVVLHRDRVDEAIGIVRVACCADSHETREEIELLESLLGYLKSQRAFCH